MKNIYKKQETRSAEANLKISLSKYVTVTLLFFALLISFTQSSAIYNEAFAEEYQGALCCGGIPEDSSQVRMLCPGGMAFGLKIKTEGLIVVDTVGVNTAFGEEYPGVDAGIKAGDIITKVSGKSVNTVKELSEIMEASRGQQVIIEVIRQGKPLALCLTPLLSRDDNQYKAGLYLKDSTAGIGTVTYIDPQSLTFGGLGHGICEGKTGSLMPVLKGEVCDVVISRVVKGRRGSPGEIRGCLGSVKRGELIKNCQTGVYGRLESMPNCYGEPLPVATKQQVKKGVAHILCTTDDNQINKYEIEITDIRFDGVKTRNYGILVTDRELISKTGGIVQGMSGSPIIQDGRIVGAVTHVLLDDPLSGYGIFIGNMLDNTPT